MKKYLRAVIGTLIFLPMSPFFFFVVWMTDDDITINGAAKETWNEYKHLIKGHCKNKS